MPTNRVRVRRNSNVQITEEMLTTFMRFWELEPIYRDCILGKCTKVPGTEGHCAACADCIAASNRLRVLTKAGNWDSTGVGADQEDVPPYASAPRAAHAWRQAWQLQLQLRELAEQRWEAES